MTVKNNSSEIIYDPALSRSTFWKSSRRKYNIGLIIAGITAFILYAILASILIEPYEKDFEITLFTIGFQGFGYLVMMGFANLFYFLGPFTDKYFNKSDSPDFRKRLYNLGFGFSVCLPFSVPLLVVIFYMHRRH